MTRSFASVALFGCAMSAAFALSGDPHAPAKPDSRIVRNLLATPIPQDIGRVNFVAPALEMLAQPSAQVFTDYLERSTWLDALGEAPLPAKTVGEAIAAERPAEPLNEVRRRALAKIISAELAKGDDALPESVRASRARFRQASPVVWDYAEQREDAPTRLLHLALTNAGRRDVMGFRADVVINVDPPVAVHCSAHEPSPSLAVMLKAGQRRVMFCGTDWQKRVPLQALVDAAQAVAEGRATMTVKPRWIVLEKAVFDLQHVEPGGYSRRPWLTTGVDHSGRRQAAALVRESSCFDRDTCFDFLASGRHGGVGELIWSGLAAGVIIFAVVAAASRLRVRLRTMVVVTVAFAALPLLAFAALMGTPGLGLGVLILPMLGAYLWIAWAIGFWGAWLVSLPLLRRGAERREIDDPAARDA